MHIYSCRLVAPSLTECLAFRDQPKRIKPSEKRLSACKDFLKQKRLPLQKLPFSCVNQANMHSFVSFYTKLSREFVQETGGDKDLSLLRLREQQLLDEIKSLKASQHHAIEQLQVMKKISVFALLCLSYFFERAYLMHGRHITTSLRASFSKNVQFLQTQKSKFRLKRKCLRT